MKDIILVGIQGSGKGTQAKIMAEKSGYHIIGTGDLFRAIKTQETELARKIKTIVNSGDLVPDTLTLELVEIELANVPKETAVIFDGVPRNEEQRVLLEDLLRKAGRDYHVIVIELPDEVAHERMLKRATEEGRTDDTPDAIAKRIQNFYAQTLPMIFAWDADGKSVKINGNQEITDVQKDLDAMILE